MEPVLVPPDAENATVSPPVVTGLPYPSLAWSARTETLPAATVSGDVLTVDADVEMGAEMAVTVITVERPPARAVRVWVPAMVPSVQLPMVAIPT